MQDEFVLAKSSRIHWVDQLIYMPAAVTLCGIFPIVAFFSGKTEFWGFPLTTCVLTGIGFLLLAIIERLALICIELQTVTFLVNNLFKEKDAEYLSISLQDLDRMRQTIRQTLRASIN